MPGHGRSKNGVATLAYVRRAFRFLQRAVGNLMTRAPRPNREGNFNFAFKAP
jgi:hypothetical protein